MSIKVNLEEEQEDHRFFTSKGKDNNDTQSIQSNLGIASDEEIDSDEDVGEQKCLTLRVLQKLLPCVKNKSVWEPSQGDVFKAQEIEETKYPRILTILEHPAINILFVTSSLLSIFLMIFSEGFILESRLMWGIIHGVNTIYTFCVFASWLDILIKSKYAKTNQGYTKNDVIFSLLSVIPFDIIILVIYIFNENKDDTNNSITPFITVSRLNYLFRICHVYRHFSRLEDQLSVGDFKMFLLRTFLYITFMIHLSSCCWHRIACERLRMVHLRMEPNQATTTVCYSTSWVIKLLNNNNNSPLLRHNWNVVLEHYIASLYWAFVTCFRLGASDIEASLESDWEMAVTAITQIISWIFVIAYVSGSLTSLLVEMDTEKENFLTRRFAIDRYLDFSDVTRKIRSDVNRFYDYLWARSRGIHNWDMVEEMPFTMKSEIYYDVNKFVLDQLPILTNLEEAFLMNLSVHMKHNFHLKGEILHRKNETGSAMFYIINGHLEIMSDDNSHVIAEIRSGSAIGEIYLLQSYPHVATVRCGTECDIMVLSKQDFKKVLNQFPEYMPKLLQRLDTRLEQSGLLLALCEKHNEYPKAFRKLKEFRPENENKTAYYRKSYEMVTNVLETTVVEDLPKPGRNSDDFDGLNIDPEQQKQINNKAAANNVKDKKMTQAEATAAAYLALEGDVTRAASLARDLNIPRPPLTVTAPSIYQLNTAGAPKKDTHSFAVRIIPKLTEKCEEKSAVYVLWKFCVMILTLCVVWYYPYQFAFSNHSYEYLEYFAHLCDLVFAVDLVFDVFQVVILPQKTLETPKEILAYRAKTCYFYVRIFSFLPIEYVMGPVIGWHREDAVPYYYLLKFNRLIQYCEAVKFFRMFDADSRVSAELLFVVRFCIRLFIMIHFFTVLFEYILKYIMLNKTEAVSNSNGKDDTGVDKITELGMQDNRYYDFVFYWATEVLTGTGYGDVPLEGDFQIGTTILGLSIGITMIIYLNARVSAIMVNAERRRVSFKQTYYCLKAFMEERKFPKLLSQRVRTYYQVQWRSHEGVLIPHERSAIWDAPKTLFQNVSVAQAQKYVNRIPLFKYCPNAVITEVCGALKQYIIPPKEVILYPADRARELYLIVKGSCDVSYQNQVIGTLTDGNFFGLPGLIYGTNKAVRIETVTYCQFFCLEFDKFVDIAKRFPKFFHDYKQLRGDAQLSKPSKTIDLNDQEIQFPEQGPNLPPFDVSVAEQNIQVADAVSTYTAGIGGVPKKSAWTHLMECWFNIVLPNGTFMKWWTIFRVACAVMVANFAPVQASFSIHPTTSFFLMLIFDIIAWIDMLLCFVLGYHGKDSQLISNFRKTSMHYIKGPFLLDFLGCFPIDYIFILAHPKIILFGKNMNYQGLYHVVSSCRLNRMIQCYKLFLAGRMLENSIFRSLSFLILVQVVPMMLLFLNITACLAVLIVCGPSLNGEPIDCDRKAWIINGKMFKYFPQDEVLEDAGMTYLIAIYWVTVSALCVGFGDLDIIHDAANRKIAISVIFIGTVVSGYLSSKLTACLVGEDSRRIQIREKTKIMFRYLEQFSVPRDLRRRVKECYFSAWDKTKGIYPKDLFHALPPTLKSDAMKNLYEEKLRKSPMFKNLDNPGIRILSSRHNEVFYPEGEFLFKYGDLNGDVFFVAKGIVVGYTELGDIIQYMGAGSLLGEISALFEVQRLFTAVAATDVEIFVYKKEDFLDFLSLYPEVKSVMEHVCLVHYKDTMEAAAKSAGVKVIIPVQDDNFPEDDTLFGIKPKTGNAMTPLLNLVPPDEETNIKTPPNLIEVNDMGTAVEVSEVECEELPEFIQDPLRLPVKSDPAKESERDAREAYSRHWLATFITYGRVPRDEMGFLHIMQEKGSVTFRSAVIHPASPICSWVSFYLLITSLSCGLTAYEIAFSTDAKGEATNLITLRLTLEIFFIIRIFGNFQMGFYDDSGAIIMNRKEITKRYAFSITGLWLDLITTLPFYLISYIIGDLGNETLSADIRGLQLLRVFLFARYLKETESDLRMKASLVKIVKVTILLCFIFHFCACAWYLVACNGMHCSKNSWMTILLKELQDQKNKLVTSSDAKVEITIGSRYLISLYYVTNAITFTGLSDITPRTATELILTIVMIFTTVFVIGFLVGEMTQCLASQVASKIHYRHRLRVMKHHFHSLGLSAPKINEVRQYFRLLWLRCNGMAYTNLLAELPYSLRADIAMKVYGPNIKNGRIVGKLDDTITRQLSAKIRHEIYMPGAHIVRMGDVCTAVYFIKRGEVVILDENANMELCVEILYENECFGEVKVLLTQEQFRFSYVARLETEVGVLFREDLEEVLGRHHGLFEELSGKANAIKNNRLAMKDEEDRIGLRTLQSKTSVESGNAVSKDKIAVDRKDKFQ